MLLGNFWGGLEFGMNCLGIDGFEKLGWFLEIEDWGYFEWNKIWEVTF